MIDIIEGDKDKGVWNSLKQDRLSGKVEDMEMTSSLLSFQSISNPKVKITLEFSNPDVSVKAEKELNDIFKNILLEKYKNRDLSYGGSKNG